MGLEIGVLLFLIFSITGLIALAVPKPKPPEKPDPLKVVCPRCKTKTERSCPNCGNAIPKGTLLCPKCNIAAKSIPCALCKTDLQSVT